MEAHSGHYRPSPENFEALVRILIESGADLSFAKVQSHSTFTLSFDTFSVLMHHLWSSLRDVIAFT